MSGRIDYEHMDKNVKVDLKDRRILSLLSENARMPLTQIAKKVQLSRDAVNYRVKRLQDKGIILKFTANISYSKLGFKLFHIFLLLDERDKEKQKALIEQVKNHPNVLSVIEYSDRWDLEIAIIARNILEFDKILSGISESFPEIILEKEKLEVIRRYNSDYVPPLINESHITEKIEYYAEKTVQLDETDIKLLKILTEDSRMSTYIIGEKLGINADTVSYRIKKLLKERTKGNG